ncbi:MAG TPA: pentapeptide repeat-containing protein [Sporichthyaceae bacterium]|jgi:hypothetical protein|nr:pentapeptide repeat-containing protein [Sporichthyaceae bacterium]
MNTDDRSRYPGAVTAQPWPAIRLDDTSDPWAPVRRHCRPVTVAAALLVLVAASVVPAQPAGALPALTTPTMTTQASAGGPVGVHINDQVTLSGGTVAVGGTITVTAYGPDDTGCTTVANTSPPITVTANGTYTSAAFAPTVPGTYYFIASYSGDAVNNGPKAGTCGDANESVVITHPQNGIPGSPFCDGPGTFSSGSGNQGWGNLGHGNQGNCNVGDGNQGDQNDGDGSVVNHPGDD